MEIVLGGIVYCVLLVTLSVATLWGIERVRGALWRWRNPPEKLAAERRAFEERVCQPDWAFYERHLQRPIPAPLRELYADRDLICAGYFELDDGDDGITVTGFEPLDENALRQMQTSFKLDVVPLATSEGDPIYLRPGPDQPDDLFITYHDGGDTAELNLDITEFVRQARLR